MIVKGIVSTVDRDNGIIEVILPEYNNVVVRPFKTYRAETMETLRVNDFVVVAIFNGDYSDCIIL